VGQQFDAPSVWAGAVNEEVTMSEAYTGPAAMPRGSRVVLVVSQGPSPTPLQGQVQVPGVLRQPQGDALTQLQNAGLRARVFNDYSASHPRGSVIGQLPRENGSAPSGSEVVLLVSSGPAATEQAPAVLPDVVGATEADAVNKMQSAGLSPQVVHEHSPVVPAGLVMDQLPNSIDLAAAPKKRSPWVWVAIVVALIALAVAALFILRGCQTEMVEVPDVVGMQQEDAIAELEDAGFEAQEIEAEDPGDADEGEVVAEEPAPGTEAPEGSTVVISVVGAPKPVAVPDVIGLTEKDAEAKLGEAGLRASARTREDASAKPGTVIVQSPVAGTELAPGSRVDITVATEAAPTELAVPDVSGQSRADAEQTLEDAGLEVTVVENPSDTVDKGDVILQLPTAGTIVAPGSEVAIVVSSGPPETEETVSVPDVVGMPRADAEKALRDAGLEVESVAVGGTTEKVGEVFAQAPVAGTSVPVGSTVTVVFAE